MTELAIKALVSGIIVAAASEAARRSTAVAAIIVSLPLTSILALAWLWRDTGDAAQVAQFSHSILLVVLPSVVLFAVLPQLLGRGVGFWLSLALSCAAMAAAYAAYAWVLSRLGLGSA